MKSRRSFGQGVKRPDGKDGGIGPLVGPIGRWALQVLIRKQPGRAAMVVMMKNDDVDNSAPHFNEKHTFVAMLDGSTIAWLEIGLLQRCCIVLQSSASRPLGGQAVQTAQQAGRGQDEDEGAP